MSNIVVTNGKISAVKLVTSESITTPVLTADNSLIYKGKELADILDESAAGSNGPFVKLEGGNEITGNQTITGELTVTEDSESSGYPGQLYFSGIPTEMLSDAVYDLGVLNENKDLSGIRFADISTHVQTCEIWFSIGDETYDIYWPENMLWLDSTDGNAPAIVVRTEYRVAIRKEANGSMVASIAYAVGEGQQSVDEMIRDAAQKDGDNTFTGANTFTGEVDMSGAQVTPPEGWNVEGVELTAEAIQAVVPLVMTKNETAPYAGDAEAILLGDNARFTSDYANATDKILVIGNNAGSQWNGIALGHGASALRNGTAIGTEASAFVDSLSIGNKTKTQGYNSVAVGTNITLNAGTYINHYCEAHGASSVSVGVGSAAKTNLSVTLGGSFTELVDNVKYDRPCTTEGTGSITIGAGANTLNNGTTESSNSVTIGCKASNQGTDSVVMGAQAKATAGGMVAIGAGAESLNNQSTAIGGNAKAKGIFGVAVGHGSDIGDCAVAIGYKATAHNNDGVAIGYISTVSPKGTAVGMASQAASYSTAIGYQNKVTDVGVVGFSARAGETSPRTKLYFAGANTTLANEYYNGEAFMGYTVTDTAGTVLACGTRRLSELFPDNSLTQPAFLDENGEWIMPKVFRPSDLDLPIEEQSEPEEYTPLPVYPIVEPEVEEI